MNKKKMALVLMTASAASVTTAHITAQKAYATPINSQVKAQYKKGKVINVTSSLRLRKEANTNSEVIGHLYNGEVFVIKEKNGHWYHIDKNGKQGYVHKDYVEELQGDSSSGGNGSTSSKGQVINVTSSLRVRQNADINSVVVGHLSPGQTFNIKGKNGAWYHIESNGVTGHVHADYVKELNGNVPDPTPPTDNEQSVNGKGKVVNVTSSLRIRKSADVNSTVVGSLAPGETFNIKGKKGEWYHIEAKGTTGYIHRDYVQEIDSNNSGDSGGNNGSSVSKKGKVINVTSSLRVRQSASTSSSVIGSLSPNEVFDIKGKNGAWYHIHSNGTVGFVHGDYVKEVSGDIDSGDNSGGNTDNNGGNEVQNEFWGEVVNVTSSLRVRQKPTTNSNVIGSLYSGQKVKVLASNGSWYKINFNGSTGYVSKDYIRKSENGQGEGNGGSGNVDATATFNKVFSIMKEHVGTPYIYGGAGEYLTSSLLNSLRKRFPDHAARGFYNINPRFVDAGYRAFDCSGLMQWAFNKVGIRMGRTTWDQIEAGVEVPVKSAKPGDLLFYHDLGHVGMYIGNNQWIEAPNKNATVRITNVQWNKIGRARRVIG